MCHSCGFETGAFANLSVIMNLLSTSSGILGLSLGERISENSMLNADVLVIHLSPRHEITGSGPAWLSGVRRPHNDSREPLHYRLLFLLSVGSFVFFLLSLVTRGEFANSFRSPRFDPQLLIHKPQ